jgi:aquaporin Z
MLDGRKLFAEFIGTAVLVFVAVGTATETFGFKLFGGSVAAGVVTTAFAFGLVLIGLAYAIGPVSGAHVNPAVTMGFMVARRMKVAEGLAYMLAQVLGAILGATALFAIFSQVPGYSRLKQGMGTDGYGKLSMIGLKQPGAFMAEAILTLVFVMVVLMSTHKAAIQGAAGVAIGMTLAVVHLIGIPLTGTSVNPARSIGPALYVGGQATSQLWLFIVAPLVGAIVAALIHMIIHPHENVEIVEVDVVVTQSA